MSTRTLLVSVALLVVSGAAHSQPRPATPPSPIYHPPPGGSVPPLPSVPVAPPVPVPLPEKSVEDLLNELERVKAQKAELEKKEQELKATLGKKLEVQAERLKKLGVAPKEAKQAEPDRVGKIIIEGNAKTPDATIRNLLPLFPGRVLEYPLLEASRQNLEKYGFLGVTVEVVPGEAGSHGKDVRVKVIEPPAVPKP